VKTIHIGFNNIKIKRATCGVLKDNSYSNISLDPSKVNCLKCVNEYLKNNIYPRSSKYELWEVRQEELQNPKTFGG